MRCDQGWWSRDRTRSTQFFSPFRLVLAQRATLRDGEFHVLGTFIGTLIIVFGFSGLNIFGGPTFSQYIFQGAILIVAVGLSSLGRLLAES